VCLRAHNSVVGNYEYVSKAVEYARRLGYQVRLIALSRDKLLVADKILYREFAELNNINSIVYSDNFFDISKSLGQCSLVLSMKFHGLIVSSLYGVPTIQMSSTPKNRNFLRYIQRGDLLSNYLSEELQFHIPKYPAKIHSLLRRKLKRDAAQGYSVLIDSMKKHIL